MKKNFLIIKRQKLKVIIFLQSKYNYKFGGNSILINLSKLLHYREEITVDEEVILEIIAALFAFN